jgi:hypothetical protein
VEAVAREREGASVLPPTLIDYDRAANAEVLDAGRPLFSTYDAGGYRVFEAARVARVTVDEAWASVQRFPEIWATLATAANARHVVKARPDARAIDVGNIILADAVVFGLRLRLRNEVTRLVECDHFQLSVRALGGRFESEVEARVRRWSASRVGAPSERTLLAWRQAYPAARLLSFAVARLIRAREATETREILERWYASVAAGGSAP